MYFCDLPKKTKIVKKKGNGRKGNEKGKVGLWVFYPNIIAFSKPNNGKYDNQLLL